MRTINDYLETTETSNDLDLFDDDFDNDRTEELYFEYVMSGCSAIETFEDFKTRLGV